LEPGERVRFVPAAPGDPPGGFRTLAEHLRSYPRTDDPVADLAKQGWAYCLNALTNAAMYRVMFMEVPLDEGDAKVGRYAFEMLLDAVRRCIDAGRFERGDPEHMGSLLWAGVHAVSALVAGMMQEDQVLSLMAPQARPVRLVRRRPGPDRRVDCEGPRLDRFRPFPHCHEHRGE